MMKHPKLHRSVIDGCFCFCIYIILLTVITSDFAHKFSFKQNLLISIGFALLRSFIYLFFLTRDVNVRRNFLFSIGSIGVFVFCISIGFLSQLTFPIKLLTRELNNADGISIIATMMTYILSSLIFKSLVFLFFSIKNKINQRNNQGTVL